jgi:predicted amidohydrolase YtcJ
MPFRAGSTPKEDPVHHTTTGNAADSPADLVLRGGIVHTLDAANTTGAAVAVRRGRILLVGTTAEVEATIGRHTRVIDLDGRTVIPGINDSHLHATWLGALWPQTIFGGDAEAAVDGQGGVGGRDGVDGHHGVDRSDEVDGHGGVGGRDGADARDGLDGHAGVDRRGGVDEHGAADGHRGLDGHAAGYAGDPTPTGAAGDPHDTSHAAPLLRTRPERRAAILRAGRLIASLGITSYTEPGLGPGEDAGATGCFGQDVLDAYRDLDAERALTARVNVLALYGVLDGPSSLGPVLAGMRALRRGTERPDRLRIAGVKIFADGIPPMHQAWTRHTYPDGTHGGLLVDGLDAAERAERLTAMIREAARLGLQVGVHATGDRTIDTVVEAVAAARAEFPADLRHYIIHGDLITAAALDRMRDLGMGLNVQPGIAVRTSPWLAGVLGDDVAATAWPLEAARAAGVAVSLSSDAPILAPDWRQGIADADAWMGASAPGEERARMRGLLHAYTTVPAYQDGAESWKGSLEPGKAADLVVLAADPLQLSPTELPSVAVDLTVVDGEIVYDRARPLPPLTRAPRGA